MHIDTRVRARTHTYTHIHTHTLCTVWWFLKRQRIAPGPLSRWCRRSPRWACTAWPLAVVQRRWTTVEQHWNNSVTMVEQQRKCVGVTDAALAAGASGKPAWAWGCIEVCVIVHVFVCVCVYCYVCMCVYVCAYVCICVRMCLYVFVCIYMCVCECVVVCICVCIYAMCVCVCVYLCACVFVCMCVRMVRGLCV
jgi:hypothetical protein